MQKVLCHALGEGVGIWEATQKILLIVLKITLVHLEDLAVGLFPVYWHCIVQLFINHPIAISHSIACGHVAHP